MRISQVKTIIFICAAATLLFCVLKSSAQVPNSRLNPPTQADILSLLAKSTRLPSDDIELKQPVLEKATEKYAIYRVEFRPDRSAELQHFGFIVRCADDIRPFYWSKKSSADSVGTFEDAKELLVEEILGSESTKSLVLGCAGVLSSSTYKLKNWRGSIDPPFESYWLFFLDDDPTANWEHPCRYVFIRPQDGSLYTRFARTPLAVTYSEGKVEETLKLKRLFAPKSETKPRETPRSKVRDSESSYLEEPTSTLPLARDPNNCYAVIISGGYNALNNWPRYWGDAAFIYSTLTLKYSYLDDHIHVLISDGTDPGDDRNIGTPGDPIFDSSPQDLDGDGNGDIDDSATLANVQSVFNSLQTQLTASDQLFVFVTDHGGQESGQDAVIWLWNEEQLEDNELADLTRPFTCPVFFVLEPCYSGGFIDDLLGTMRAIATACDYDEPSHAGDTYPDYDEWCYHWTAAMRGCEPGANPWDEGEPVDADANGDGFVSFREASHYAMQPENHPPDDDPQYAESPVGLGFVLFLGFFYLIPTLTQWGLIILVVLIVFSTWVVLRRRKAVPSRQ